MTEINNMKWSFNRSANGALRARLCLLCCPTGSDAGRAGDIKTAVSEAVTNCIVHAYPDTLGKSCRARIFDDNSIKSPCATGAAALRILTAPVTHVYDRGRPQRDEALRLWRALWNCDRSHLCRGTTVTMRRRISVRPNEVMEQTALDF